MIVFDHRGRRVPQDRVTFRYPAAPWGDAHHFQPVYVAKCVRIGSKFDRNRKRWDIRACPAFPAFITPYLVLSDAGKLWRRGETKCLAPTIEAMEMFAIMTAGKYT